jgi:hypothetical protein
MSTVTTPTNVSLIQRDASSDNQFINLLGSANLNKAIGFNGSGVVSALATPLLTAANTFTADQTVQGKLTVRAVVGTDANVTAAVIDWATGTSFYKTLAANTVFAFSNVLPGQEITVAVTNTASNYTVTWPTVTWSDGIAPAQSLGAVTDVYTFRNINGIIRGSVVRGPLERRVSTVAELSAALALGGIIYVTNMITVSATVALTVPGTKLIGRNGGGIIFPYLAGSLRYVVRVQASDCEVSSLKITSNHPLTPSPDGGDVGIHLNPSAGNTLDRLVIENNDIYNIATGIFGNLGDTGVFHNSIRIEYNYIHAFAFAGMYLEGNTRNILVNKNRFYGRDEGQTHISASNGVWIGINCQFPHITNNEITGFGRHGIEYWNRQYDPDTIGGNMCGKIAFNNIHSPAQPGGFAISAFGNGSLHIVNNSVIGPFGIGYEVYNDPTNGGPILIQGNYAEGITGSNAQFISANNTRSCSILGNTLKNTGNTTAGSNCFGIQIIHGAEDLSIKNNIFIDLGAVGVLLNGITNNIAAVTPGAVTRIETVNVFATGNEMYTGKVVFISGVNGDPAWDAIQGYWNVTLVNSDGTPWTVGTPRKYFTIPVNSSAFPAGAGELPFPPSPANANTNSVQLKYTKISVCDNKFVNTRMLPTAYGGGFNYAMNFASFQNASIRNNEFWNASGLTYRAIQATASGTLYLGNSTDAPIVITAAAPQFDIADVKSNIKVTYLEGVIDI